MPMSMRTKNTVLWVLAVLMAQTAQSQTEEFHGQASAWVLGNPGNSPATQVGLRYIPDFLAERPLGGGLDANMELSLNAFGTAKYTKNQPASYESDVKLYRAWFRISTDRFETRIGLQKINFGSALLFRPLMWFDRIDPRDPLQLTAGVYALLARYTFQENANIWLWGLYGNNDTKGWEVSPTEKKTIEYGGRVQSPLWTGEIGITYHHRRIGLSPPLVPGFSTPNLNFPEERLGLDGKWDIGIGAWFEAALIHEETALPVMKYQRQWTVGGDYTFAVGNGLYVATEYFGMENPPEPFASADGLGFSGLSVSYPVGILDQVSAIVYRDWRNEQWYRIVNWQRKYDNWSLYLLGFWNPETIQIYRAQGGSNAFAGKGVQIIIVFNH
jgi:hypothetical protein